MISWGDFQCQQPDLAGQGASLLYHFGVGLAFLATVQADGGPRVHPVCPLLADTALYAFIVPAPKQRDLHRDGRYAMHSFPLEDNEDAFYLSGVARHVLEPEIRHRLGQQFAEERAQFAVAMPGDDQHLFVFELEAVMITRTTGHGDPRPKHTVWRAT